MRSNALELSVARRNKYVMGETVRAAGLRAVKQLRATAWPEIAAFLEEWNPSRSSRWSNRSRKRGVRRRVQVHERRGRAQGLRDDQWQDQRLGHGERGRVVQEFLAGTEYVVDSVSRDGVHKTLALWNTTNGA